jgi:hypothetical protein
MQSAYAWLLIVDELRNYNVSVYAFAGIDLLTL